MSSLRVMSVGVFLALAACAADPISVSLEPVQNSSGGTTEAAGGEPPDCVPTPADMEGPYYIAGAPFKNPIAPSDLPGDRLVISGTVLAADCVTPLAGAVVDIWQADSEGVYDFSDDFILRGKVEADADGQYSFETVMPGYYGDQGNIRPLHIHVRITHPDTAPLITQIYFAHDPRSAGAPPGQIITAVEESGGWSGTFVIILPNL